MQYLQSLWVVPFLILFMSLSMPAACAPDDEGEVENLDRQFRRLFDTQQYDQAGDFAKNALHIVEAKRGQSHLDVSRMLDNLELVYRARGKFDQAQRLSERTLEIRTKLLGEEHLDVALNLNNVASLQIIRGQYQQAEPLLQRTLAVMEKIFGSNHPSVAMSLNNLAVVHHQQGRYQQAELLIRRALAIREKAFPTGHLDPATSLNNLAALDDMQGRHAEAKRRYQNALEMLEKDFSQDGSSLTTVLNNLSRLNLVQGNFSEAESFIKRSLSILQEGSGEYQRYGEDHLELAYGLSRLGELRLLQGDYGQAESAFTRSLEILDKTLGTNHHPNSAGVIRHLVSLYKAEGREQEAVKLAGRVGDQGDLVGPSQYRLLPPKLKLSGDSVRPMKILTLAPPIYPEILRRWGTKGSVLVRITVTEEGLVQSPFIMESAHPTLEKAVLDSLLTLRCIPPLTLSGKKTSIIVLQPFNFVLKESSDTDPFLREGGDGDPSFRLPTNTERLPVEFQYDVPPTIKVVAPVVYPVDLLRKDIEGAANVSVVIDPKGEVREVNILDVTHPEFGLATRAMMQSWTYRPATKKGEPTWAIFMFSQRFSREGRDTSISAVTEELLHKKEDSSEIYSVFELDARPEPVYAPQPVYPFHLKGSGVMETVVAEFFIDKDGWVHLPRLIEAKNDELGWLALTAMSRWRFTPPLKAGKPVVARIRMPMRFQPE